MALALLLLQLLGPALSKVLVDLVTYFEAHTDDAEFVTECALIAQGICMDHPDWSADEQHRWATDAILIYATRQGRVVPLSR